MIQFWIHCIECSICVCVSACMCVCSCVSDKYVGSMADNPCMCESYEVGVATNALSVKSHRVLQS